MKKSIKPILAFALLLAIGAACKKDDSGTTTQKEECRLDNSTSYDLSQCKHNNQQAGLTPTYLETVANDVRTIQTNGVPNHNFGSPPNIIAANDKTWEMDATPTKSNAITTLIGADRIQYDFGVALNGVKMDPESNFAFEDTVTGESNYNWVLEAINNTSITTLDCNHGHLQPDGSYHYHGDFVEYANVEGIDGTSMVQVGWAADGFPVYYKYAYSNPNDENSSVVEMHSSYQLKSGERPGDGISAPCGTYNGRYTQDYGYVSGLGDLDECNGRTGITPEFPSGTYYYVITSDFPIIPRCFWGRPDESFEKGR